MNIVNFIGVTSIFLSAMELYAAGSEGVGGDTLLNRFAKAKKVAEAIVLTTHEELFFDSDDEIRDFYINNRQNLLKEIKKAELVLRQSNPNGHCGQTSTTPFDPIFLSMHRCDGITLEEAAEIILVECIHHFGKDDTFAASAMNAIMKNSENGIPFYRPWKILGENKHIRSLALELDENRKPVVWLEAYSSYRIDGYKRQAKLRKLRIYKVDKMAGKLFVEGRFTINWDVLGNDGWVKNVTCEYPSVLEVHSQPDGRKINIKFWNPREIHRDCSYSKSWEYYTYTGVPFDQSKPSTPDPAWDWLNINDM